MFSINDYIKKPGALTILVALINYFLMLFIAGVGHSSDFIIIATSIGFLIQSVILSLVEEIVPVISSYEKNEFTNVVKVVLVRLIFFALSVCFIFFLIFDILISFYTDINDLLTKLLANRYWILLVGFSSAFIVFLGKVSIAKMHFDTLIIYEALISSTLGISIVLAELILPVKYIFDSKVILIRSILIFIIMMFLGFIFYLENFKRIKIKPIKIKYKLEVMRSIKAKFLRTIPSILLDVVISNFLTNLGGGSLSLYYYANRISILLKTYIVGGRMNMFIFQSINQKDKATSEVKKNRLSIYKIMAKDLTIVLIIFLLFSILMIYLAKRINIYSEINIFNILILSISLLISQYFILNENLYAIYFITNKRFWVVFFAYSFALFLVWIGISFISLNSIFFAPILILIFYMSSSFIFTVNWMKI